MPRRAYVAAVLALFAFTSRARSLAQACSGDCNADGAVAINELVLAVNIALDTQDVRACSAADANHDSRVTVDELVRAVNVALSGCGAVMMPTTPSMPDTGTPTATTPASSSNVWGSFRWGTGHWGP